VPFYVGASAEDSRYATPEVGSKFLQISKISFGCYKTYHDGIREIFDPYEATLFEAMPKMEKQYMNLKASGKSMDAQMLLDVFLMQHWQEAIELTESTLQSMTKLTVESSAWSR